MSNELFAALIAGSLAGGGGGNVYESLEAGVNITIEETSDGKAKISASGEVSSEDTVARAAIAEMKDGTNIDSFGDVETALATKADTSSTYTKTEVDTALGNKVDKVSGKGLSTNDFTTAEKTKLDDLAEIKSIGTGLNLDSTTGELTATGGGGGGFTPTTAQLAAMNSGITAEKLQADETALAGKVDKETGKGLSTNDYTDAEKTKLAGIAEGAEVNVQSNWTQTTTTADDYIKNKPTLGTAAAKNATDTYNATGDDLTTGKAVAAALATLPEPMVFKGSLGTGGTITTLPTASSSNKGYVYKVITAGTYASQSAKIGDTFISDGSAWVLIPSGDEPSGTVTNVAVANGGGLSVSGSPVTSSGTITIGHSNSVTAKTSSSLKKFTYDAYGHVTGSSELSTAESNALASGIDSTKVAQISTNQTNIGKVQTQANWNTNNGVKNLLNNILISGTVSSQITATVSTDNQVTLSGTAPSNADASFTISTNAQFPAGTYIGSGCPSGGATDKYRVDYVVNDSTVYRDTGSGVEFTLDSASNVRSQIVIYRGNAAPSAAFKPMLTPKSLYDADSTYQPYSLPNTKITPELIELVDSGAKNLYNPSNTSTSASGLTGTITRNSDGSYTISGTTSGTVYYNMGSWTTPEDGYYILSGGSAAESASQLIYDDHDWQTYESDNKKKLAYWTKGSTHNLYIRLGANITLSNVTFYPMICSKAAWDVSQKFVPYGMSNAELTKFTPVTLSKRYAPQSADYEIISDLTISIPAGKKYLIHAMAMFNNVAPKGVVINKGNTIAANKNTVYAEITNDVNDFGGLTTSAIMSNTGSTAFDACIFAKFKAASTSGSDVIVTYQDIT